MSSAFSRVPSPAADDAACVDAALAAFARKRPPLPLGVAYSGGADSTALLLGCARLWPGQVVALHVNHGLQEAASAFESHCAAFCQRLGVPLRVRRVQAAHAKGESPEAAARAHRYEALLALAAEPPALRAIALAQHADDQVETVLLALSRGAGLPGLAAMPARWQRGGLAWARPFLRVPGAALREWLAKQGLKAVEGNSAGNDAGNSAEMGWVEDPSNASARYTRNRIRAQVLPALQAALPGFRTAFARSAAHAAQAQQLLQEVAAQDLAACGAAPPVIAALQSLSPARQANVLRYWLAGCHASAPSSAQMTELLAQIAACTTRGHRLRLKVGAGYVLRQGERLQWLENG